MAYDEETYNLSSTAISTLQQRIEDNWLFLRAHFAGGASPANPTEGQTWYDTSKEVMKFRNDDPAWIGFFHGDGDSKIWMYRNTALDGWLIDSSVTDAVIALKGGSVYTTGGASAGTWTISGLTINNHSHTINDHNHQVLNADNDADDHDKVYNSSGSTVSISAHSKFGGSPPDGRGILAPSQADAIANGFSYDNFIDDFYTDNTTDTTSSEALSINVGSAWRPVAAVGTMQYLDL